MIDQFFAAVMGKCMKHDYPHSYAEAVCRKCGMKLGDNPISLFQTEYIASLNGEISYEVRKWFQEYEPDVWKTYLEKTMYDLKMWPDILNAQLSIQNFYSYLTEHFQEWGYKKCQYCDGIGSWPDTGFERKQCLSCNGTGRVCKYPEAEKIIKEDN